MALLWAAVSDTPAISLNAMLCDSVANADQKLWVQGAGWTVLGAYQYPLRQPRIGVAAVAHVPWELTPKEHHFELRLERADGAPIFLGQRPAGPVAPGAGRMPISIEVTRPEYIVAGDEQPVCVAYVIDGVTLPTPDRYRFIIAVNGVDTTSLWFRAVGP